jgi:3-deoxy-manno-octulosonate cytidylyltransferase (CMP-KDO synthetase)
VNHFLGIIPARYASTRFPGKPLALLRNKPMIQWVYERASVSLPYVVVATDNIRIKEAVEGFGGEAVMTSSNHKTGTERCAEALRLLQKNSRVSFTHVINIQGDEPLLKQEHLEALKGCFTERSTQIATLIQPMHYPEDLANPNVVKVVVDKAFRALYFSRSPVPFTRVTPAEEARSAHTFFTHIGLYAFRAELLQELTGLPVSPLEKAESLEQLRWLENGYHIQTVITDHPAIGVDTPEDLEKIRNLI